MVWYEKNEKEKAFFRVNGLKSPLKKSADNFKKFKQLHSEH